MHNFHIQAVISIVNRKVMMSAYILSRHNLRISHHVLTSERTLLKLRSLSICPVCPVRPVSS